MFLCETARFFGFPFRSFCCHALDDPPYGFGTSQPVAFGNFCCFLYVAGRVVSDQIDERVHAALTATAFFLEPCLAQIEGVRADAFGLGEQPVRFPGWIEDPDPRDPSSETPAAGFSDAGG